MSLTFTSWNQIGQWLSQIEIIVQTNKPTATSVVQGISSISAPDISTTPVK